MKNRIAVIGGGAAGLFASANAERTEENEITVFEKNAYTGKKLLITGKGRCNVTTAEIGDEFFSNIPTNPRFLYSSFNTFDNFNTIDFFESIGLKLKTERGMRVFPESDKASDVRDALFNRAVSLGVKFVFEKVLSIEKENDKFFIKTTSRYYEFDKVIIATGGVSYPLTGSTGDGYEFAGKFSHTVIPPKPSLVPLVCREKYCRDLMGLSLRNVRFTLKDKTGGKVLFEDFGEMLFTHYGISGPVVLSASSHIKDFSKSEFSAYIDLKPALTHEVLDKRLLSDFSENKNRDFLNSLSALLPSKLIPTFVSLSGIPERKKVNEITREERHRLVELLKNFPLTIVGTRPISEAIITSGGINTSEINPKTMESKKVSGLFFAGEVIDVDAYTGGFNLQIAFSTAYSAIKHAQI